MNLMKRCLLPLGAFFSFLPSVGLKAAEVPKGTRLAKVQKLVRGNSTEPKTLDPGKAEGVVESHVLRDLFEALTTSSQDGTKVLPGVAERWSHKDFKVWTFYLRSHAKWSNGAPITAQDFVYSWQRLANPETASSYAAYLSNDAHILNAAEIIGAKAPPSDLGVRAIDRHVLEVTLTQPTPYFDKLVAHTCLVPLYRECIESHGSKWTQPLNMVCNGAYRFREWVVNERIVLEKNHNYWNDSKTVIKEVTFLPVSSELSMLKRYRSGEVDMTHGLPFDHFQKLRKSSPEELKTTPSLSTSYVEINLRNQKFADERVRRALKIGLDRTIIVEKVRAMGDCCAFEFAPPYMGSAEAITQPEWAHWSQEARNAEGRRLLAEAGFTPKNPLTISLLYCTSETNKKLAVAIASMWQKHLGIQVKLTNKEWKSYLSSRHHGEHELALAGWAADYNEASNFLNVFASTSSISSSFYASKAFDALLAQATEASSDEERAKLYAQAEALLDEDSTLIPLFHKANCRMVKPWVKGYFGKPMDDLYTKDLYIIQH